MSRGDSARTYYESARRELIQRIRLRDNVLLFYLGGVGTIAGVALGSSGAGKEIMLVLPFLALGVATIVSQHNALIGSLGHFCVHEIEPFLQNLHEPEDAPQWDSSVALEEYKEQAIRLRSLGHTVMILAPALAGLAINYQHVVGSALLLGLLWWVGFLCVTLATLIIYRSYSWRDELYDGMFDGETES
ncbi:hypothetical protein [Halorussus litoreus]|uniref:hypothetical protein n=1 Tax=Halorussus litoreus TaxID=1710536 RepID=UPI000E21FF9B|nr:hypothetical protein [Halorussus litoreus]